MPNNTLFIEKMNESLEELRVNLEGFLEDYEGFAQPDNIRKYLQILVQLMKAHGLEKVTEALVLSVPLVDKIQPLHEGYYEQTLLKLCLLLSRLLEDLRLEMSVNEDLFDYFIKDLKEQTSAHHQDAYTLSVDPHLLKILRMTYQKQLIQLIKGKQPNQVLMALAGVCHDIQRELPQRFQIEWNALSYYVTQMNNEGLAITPAVHHLLAMMDHRFNQMAQDLRIRVQVLPELLKAIRGLSGGEQWIAQYIPDIDQHKTIITISAATYARFANSAKEYLLKLHEGFELLAIDFENKKLLNDNVAHLAQLSAILRVMNKPNIAQLAQNIFLIINQFNTQQINNQILLDVVTQFWVLESFINRLWRVDDQFVPLTLVQVSDWVMTQTKANINTVLAEQYASIRNDLEISKEAQLSEKLCESILKAINIAQFVKIIHPLSSQFKSLLVQGLRDKAVCLEVLLALEYCARRSAQGKEIQSNVVTQAEKMLEAHLVSHPELTPLVRIDEKIQATEMLNESDEPIDSAEQHKKIAKIINKVDSICSEWEQHEEATKARAELHTVLNQLCDLCIAIGLEQAGRLSYEWVYWLSQTDSPVVVAHVPYLKNAVRDIAKQITQDPHLPNLTPYFQFIEKNYVALHQTQEVAGATHQPVVDPEVIEVLKTETKELLDAVQSIVILGTLEQDQIIALRRSAHTLRGIANMVGLNDAAGVAQSIEKQLEIIEYSDVHMTQLLTQSFNIIFMRIYALIGLETTVSLRVME